MQSRASAIIRKLAGLLLPLMSEDLADRTGADWAAEQLNGHTIYFSQNQYTIPQMKVSCRGCRHELIMFQDPCKSDLDLLFFFKVLKQIILISMLIEEYQIIFVIL